MSLIEFRERNGWSQGRLARMLGCAQASIGRWEKGKLMPSDEYQHKLGRLGFEGKAYASRGTI